jgi:hypothetical protein
MPTADVKKSNIRKRLLEVFESMRESPGSDFEPERLIHYLIENPKGNLNVHNSFKGKRYFVKFKQQVETTFAVCFSNNDLETLLGITTMTERVDYLQRTPKSSLTVISNRLREPFNPNMSIFILVIFLPVIGFLFKTFSFFGLVVLALPVLLILLLIRSHHQERIHYQTLRDQITKASAES